TLLAGVAVLQKAPKAPGQPDGAKFLEALALLQGQRDVKAVAQDPAQKKELDDLKAQNKTLSDKLQKAEKDAADAQKALETEQTKTKAAASLVEQAKKALAAEQARTKEATTKIEQAKKDAEKASEQTRKELVEERGRVNRLQQALANSQKKMETSQVQL